MAMLSKWSVTGSYFESCNCNSVFPCVFTSDPTTGECTVLLAWHIDKGKYGDVSVGGLSTALAAYSLGNMLKIKWDVALYIDEKGNLHSARPLSKIFGGQAGGEPAALGPLVGKVIGVNPVPIFYQAQRKEWIMRISGIATIEVVAIEGQGGKLVTIEYPPMIAVPNQTIVAGRSKKLSFHDHGWNWEITEKNGFYAPFSFKGP